MAMWDTSTAAAIIREAQHEGRSALDEHDSKRFLACYGIPVSRETVAPDPATASAEAEKLGFPVVLKACGSRLLHKTEVSGVALDLRSAA